MKNLLLVCGILTQLILAGCATPAWNKYPIQVAPDYNCFYGGPEGGTMYYVWKCLDSKRVVIRQSGFGFWTASADKYESSCEGKTEIESDQDLDSSQQQCRKKLNWKTESLSAK